MNLFVLAALLAAVLPAAQAAAPDPADPRTPVPAPTYRSVVPPQPATLEQGPADWRQSNREVGEFPRGHIDLLKWEQARERPPASPAPAPAASHGHVH